jgi:hypothetical protein
MMEAVRTSETVVDTHFTWHYIPEDNSEHHTRRRENLKSQTLIIPIIYVSNSQYHTYHKVMLSGSQANYDQYHLYE